MIGAEIIFNEKESVTIGTYNFRLYLRIMRKQNW